MLLTRVKKKKMFQTLKKLPQIITLNPRKLGLQLTLFICWVVILVGTFSFLS